MGKHLQLLRLIMESEPGDSLDSIAEKLDVTPEELRKLGGKLRACGYMTADWRPTHSGQRAVKVPVKVALKKRPVVSPEVRSTKQVQASINQAPTTASVAGLPAARSRKRHVPPVLRPRMPPPVLPSSPLAAVPARRPTAPPLAPQFHTRKRRPPPLPNVDAQEVRDSELEELRPDF